MKYLVKKGEMQHYDANTMEVFGIPSLVLIERAALAAVEELEQSLLHGGERILIAVGTGNNGADGLVMGRLLFLKGYSVELVLAGNREKATSENERELTIAKNYKIPVISATDWLEQPDPGHSYELVIDALFGVGLSRRIEGTYEQLLTRLDELQAKKVAVDIPSGIDADNGQILGVAFHADLTITFSYEKLGLVLFPGAEYAGRIVCKNVGIDDHSFLDGEGFGHKPQICGLTDEDLSLLPTRRPHSNKGTYGKVLVIAGSINMAGAAIFSAKAAYLSGCGLVRVLTPEENRTIIQSALPEAVLTTYHGKKPEPERITEALQWADVIVCGPGLGQTQTARQLVHTVLKEAAVPLVLDADALNIISEDTDILRRPHTELIITPHLGEMARLTQMPVSYLKDHLVESAQEFARTYNLICVQKDARTVTAVPFGMTYVNLSGNNGMATGGSGDVLTGVIAALLAQGLPGDLAAPLGVYIHGRAGDLAAEKYGKYSMTASSLLEALPGVYLTLHA